MRYQTLPHTDLTLSSLILGTDHFGTAVTQEAAFSLMDEFCRQGGNALDTARMYGSWVEGGDGASEKTVGAWLKSRNLRSKITLITKCAHHELNNRNHRRLSRADIRADVDESLQTLQTDTIDLLFLHRDDPDRPVEDIMTTLAELVQEGKVRYIGASNWTAARISEANAYAAKTGKPGFCAGQIKWSLAEETEETRQEDPTLVSMDAQEYSFYKEQSFPVFAFSSQAKGFFKKLEAGEVQLTGKARNRYYTEANLTYYKRAQALAQKKGVSITAIVLAYLTSQSFPSFALLGCKNSNQLNDSLSGCDLKLTPQELEFLSTGTPC